MYVDEMRMWVMDLGNKEMRTVSSEGVAKKKGQECAANLILAHSGAQPRCQQSKQATDQI